MKMQKSLFALGFLLISAPALADDISTAACGAGRDGGPSKSQVGFFESLEETKVYADGKEISRDGFQTQMDGGLQIITIFGEGDEDDRKIDINVADKTATVYLVSPDGKGRARKQSTLTCVVKGF